METISFLIPCFAKAVKQLLYRISWRCQIIVHVKTGQAKQDFSHRTPQTHFQKKCEVVKNVILNPFVLRTVLALRQQHKENHKVTPLDLCV